MIASDLQDRLLERLGDTQTGEYVQVGYYTPAEALNWLNAVQRIFVLLTLCLETTEPFIVSPGAAFFHMMAEYPDWLLPLRVSVAGGSRVLPSRLSELAALDANWSSSAGVPARYGLVGFDLLAVYQQPVGEVSLDLTYARCPDLMVNPDDEPEIPAEYQPELIEGAIPLLRAKEGGGELQKVMAAWDRFMDAAGKLAEYVRARNKELGYDRMPAELRRFDRSKMLKELADAR
jgi:hypothetical protein